ncbi:MAG: FlaG/FlaF family flagellin (archaellin) [Salinirussus sp.]|jgi:FlaG/FlaF family flagellin (archaellin)
MVAITVILAAVIATFVLGLGEQVSQTAPQANFDFEVEEDGSSNDILTVSHEGGETIDRADVAVTIGGATAYEDGSVVTSEFQSNSNNFPTEIQAGSGLEIKEDTTDESGDTEVEILYLPTEGNTATLASQTLEFN